MESLPFGPDTLRLAAFLSVFLLLAVVEQVWPRRPLTESKSCRWTVNLILVAVNSLLVRLLVPLAPFVMATLAQSKGWGLFNLLKPLGWLEIVASLLFLDLIIYLQHRLFHRYSFLWRIHRVHHTDLDLDVSSGTRFHPLEMVLSMVIKLATVFLLGASPLSVLFFEIVLNVTSMFSHANLRVPLPTDGWLRLVLVTPDMHRVHHSVIVQETNSNFGFNLPWWDRLFGTYRSQPCEGHDQMVIGLKEWRDQHELGLWPLLLLPFAPPTVRKV